MWSLNAHVNQDALPRAKQIQRQDLLPSRLEDVYKLLCPSVPGFFGGLDDRPVTGCNAILS